MLYMYTPFVFPFYHLSPTLGQGDMCILRFELYSISSKWHNLGLQLQIPTESLNCIRMENPSMPECLLKLLTVWLERTSPPPTWNILIEALESPPVGEGHLAQQLRDKYCQKGRGEGNHAPVPYSRTSCRQPLLLSPCQHSHPPFLIRSKSILSSPLVFPPHKKSIDNVCTSDSCIQNQHLNASYLSIYVLNCLLSFNLKLEH